MRLLLTRTLVSAAAIAIPVFLIAILWKPACAGSAFGGCHETLSLGTVLIKRSGLILIADAKGYFAENRLNAALKLPDSGLLAVIDLVSNGIKFNKSDPPKIHVSAHKVGREWVFSVKDNGIGIYDRYIERVFAIFERLHRR
jgi:signal transduction histidine kinase